MIDYEEALRLVLEACRPRSAELVARADARGRVLAADVLVASDLPPWRTSAMDGVAVRATDLGRGPLPLGPAVPAGTMPPPLAVGEAVPIATGAPVPEGADRVAPIEEIAVAGDRVEVPIAAARSDFIRHPGSDVARGATAIFAGARLGPAEGALLAALGVDQVRVHPRPRVAIISTGAELVAPGATPGPAQIRDANSTALAWACRGAGAEVRVLGIADDTPAATESLLSEGLEGADLLLTTGGVSVGERDLVRETLRGLGADERFWRVAIRPGKPCTCSVRGETVVLGLPGNPASAMVGVALFVLPAIATLAGVPRARPDLVPVVAEGSWPASAGRLHAVRCTLRVVGDELRAAPTGDQSSHRISSLVGAEALALVSPGCQVTAGERLPAVRLGGPGAA